MDPSICVAGQSAGVEGKTFGRIMAAQAEEAVRNVGVIKQPRIVVDDVGHVEEDL